MPPKAKAGAKAKAHPLHRPAARVRVRGVRRPAAGGGVSPWDLGQEVALATIPPGDLGPGCSLVITEGYYYGGKMKIAGEVTKLEMEGGEVNVKLKVTGTDHEGLLKTSSAHPQQQFLCHLCGAGCNKMDVGEFRVHAVRGRRRKAADEEGWVTNLVAGAAPEEEDENQELRQRAALLAGQGGEPGDPPGAEKEKRASPQDKEEESGEVKKKKKEEKPEEGERSGGWEEADRCCSERSQGRLRRYRFGSERKGPPTGGIQGAEVCVSEEAEERQRVIKRQQFIFEHRGGGLQGTVGSLRRRNKDQRSGREVPRSIDSRSNGSYEEVAADHLGRRARGGITAASGPPLLQERALPPSQWSPGTRDVEHLDGVGPPDQGSCGDCCRHFVSAVKVPRECMPRNPLVDLPAPGNPACGDRRLGGEGRVAECQKGRVRRGQDAVASSGFEWRQGRRKRQVQEPEGRSRDVEKGRQEGRTERQGQEQRQEVGRSPDLEDNRRVPGCEKGAPEAMTGARGITQGDRALLNCPGHHESTEDGRFFTPDLKNLRFFPPEPPSQISGGAVAGDTSAFLTHESLGGEDHSTVGAPVTFSECKKSGIGDLVGKRLHELGSRVHQRLLEVLSLRSRSTGRRAVADLFPLPTSECRLSALFPQLDASSLCWLQAICMSLNSLWGGDLFYEGEVNAVTVDCLTLLCRDVERFRGMDGVLESFSWPSFFSTRGVDYKGDEVKTAKYFAWKNIAPALPEEIGRVPLEQVCTLGAQHYVENFDSFIKDPSEWDIPKSPRVMVPDDQWGDVCTGLVQAGVCVFLPVEDIFDTGRGPLLNGLFGVSKDEWVEWD